MFHKNTSQNCCDQLSDRLVGHERILRSAALLSVLDISAPTLWRRVKDKSFPQPISLGGRSIGWLQSEVNEWINARAGLRDQAHRVTDKGVQS